MTEGPGRHAGEEGDFFDRWLANRDGGAPAGGARRSTTSPPTWAPHVTAPAVEPQTVPPAVADERPAEPAEARAAEAPAAEAPAAEAVLMHAPAPRSAPVAPDEPTAELAAEPDESPETPPAQEPATAAVTGAQTGRPDAPAPIRHTFRPRTRARAAVGIGALLAAAASVLGVYVASRERDAPSIGIAITLWVLTGIIWAVHSGTSVTRLSVRGGQLDVLRHGVRTTIDLTSSYTPVEVYGRPGKHGWKVIFRRRDMSAFVIDHSMVDPAEFMRVLRYYRPGVDAESH